MTSLGLPLTCGANLVRMLRRLLFTAAAPPRFCIDLLSVRKCNIALQGEAHCLAHLNNMDFCIKFLDPDVDVLSCNESSGHCGAEE